jgi:hypothetical protein
MGRIIRGVLVFCILGAGPVFFGSCGLDDYMYLSPVQESEITIRNNTQAAIGLPSLDAGESTYFTNFVIFYRIYLSDSPQAGQITPELMRTVNAALYNDYNGLFPSTSNNSSNNTTTVNTAVGSLFSGRRYYELALDGIDIASVLDSGSQGESLVIEFPNTGGRPFLTVGGGQPYELWRSNGGRTFEPKPDRYFAGHPDLFDNNNLTANINADTAGPSPTGPGYAYASLYIAKMGRDRQTLGLIYSAPTFIGVFKLPDTM